VDVDLNVHVDVPWPMARSVFVRVRTRGML